MNAAKEIIKKFGGQTSLAELLHTKQSTVQYWAKKGTIPSKWHRPIVKAGLLKGIEISPAEFSPALISQTDDSEVAVPTARWPGTLSIGENEVGCYVLGDGRRVITRTGAVTYLTNGKGGGNLESYLKLRALEPFLPHDLEEQFFEISLPQVVNKSVQAMTATSLIDICRAYSRARDTGALTSDSQIGIAIRASMLMAAFAKVGIESAIDEATGYQYERASDALKMKMDLFLENEMRPWEKTFPDELWIQFGRLTKWKGSIQQRPKYWGKLVMELVYEYLDPDVATWLRQNAPKPRGGQNYHQWLSSQFGMKKLVEHIWMLIGMASACNDMSELRQRMAEKFGRTGVQFTLFLPPPR